MTDTLKKQLNLLDVFSIAAGAMISSGLFVLPGILFARAGPAAILAYFFASVMMIPAMFSKAELATAMPRAGGSYFYIERSLGALMGTFAGLAHWLSIALKSAFALVGIGAFVSILYPDMRIYHLKLVAVAGCLVFATLNIVSVKGVGKFQTIMVVSLLGLLGYFCLRGFTAMNHAHFSPFMPYGMVSVLGTTGMVFVSYGGLTKIASVAEETRDPKRNIPLGMFLAFAVVSVFYVLTIFVVVGVTAPEKLSGCLMPISVGAGQFMGGAGEIIMGVAGLFAFVTTANSGMLSASRSPMAMSRDGLLPESLCRINRRFGTPHTSIILTTSFITFVIVFLSLEDLIKTASTMMLVLFVFVNVAVVVMRYSAIPNYRPKFRAPLCPWLQIAGSIVYGFCILEMGFTPQVLTVSFALLAAIWYLVYVRKRIERESAFVYLVKSVTSKEIQRSGLEDELMEIALERDGIIMDRFDHLVKECPILDLDGPMSAKEMFMHVAEALAPRLGKNKEYLYNLFLVRERESSTVVQPGLAIPHIIIDGSQIFAIALVRCKEGIVFSELNPPVRTAFILMGTRDERNYHLRALMTIAHIAQEPGFEERWLAARSIEQLRDIILLSGRKRH